MAKVIDKSVCQVCLKDIKISIRKNTGICSGDCEKIDWERKSAMVEIIRKTK